MNKFEIMCETKKDYKKMRKALDALESNLSSSGSKVSIGGIVLEEPVIKYKQKEKMDPIRVKTNFSLDGLLRMLSGYALDVRYTVRDRDNIPEYVVDDPIGEEAKEEAFEEDEESIEEDEENHEEAPEEGDDDEMDEREKDILSKIDRGEEFSEYELRHIVSRYEAECTYGDNGRWLRPAFSICKIGNRYFRIDWFEGLTENQESQYDKQPVEVEGYTVEETVVRKVWTEKGTAPVLSEGQRLVSEDTVRTTGLPHFDDPEEEEEYEL